MAARGMKQTNILMVASKQENKLHLMWVP